MLKVLIISTGQLPDVVHAMQVATSIKAQQADVQVSWIVRDALAPMVRLSHAADHVYVFTRNGGAWLTYRMLREVRKTNFDYVLDMQGLLRSGLMTWWVHGKRKVGRSDARERATLFYNERVGLPEGAGKHHQLRLLLEFATVFGLKPELAGPLVFRDVPGHSHTHVQADDGTKAIVMFPDSRRSEKQWHGFKELTELLLRAGHRSKVIWAGHRYLDFKDPPRASQFLNLTGNTSIVTLPSLIQHAAWVISNDSGPMHLAAAMEVPTLGIFGPTDVRQYAPYPPNATRNHAIVAPVGNMRMLSAREVFNRFVRIDGGEERHGPNRVRGF